MERTLSDSCIDLHTLSYCSLDLLLHPPSIPSTSSSATTSTSRLQQPLPQLKQNDSHLHPPPTKKKRFTTLSKEELDHLSKACVPKNTESSTRWALRNFRSWMSDRNRCNAEKCPESLLEDTDVFVAETRKVNGEPYPPMSIHLLLSGLQRHMRNIDQTRAPNIFAKRDALFQTLHQTLDSVYKKLRASGVGSQKRTNSGNMVYWVATTPPAYYVVFSFIMVRIFAYEVVKSTGVWNYPS